MTVQLSETNASNFSIADLMLHKDRLVDAMIRAAFISVVNDECRRISGTVPTDQVLPGRIAEELWGVQPSVRYLLANVVNDLADAIDRRFVAVQHSATATAIHYNLDGSVSDIDVMLDVNFSAEKPPKP